MRCNTTKQYTNRYIQRSYLDCESSAFHHIPHVIFNYLLYSTVSGK